MLPQPQQTEIFKFDHFFIFCVMLVKKKVKPNKIVVQIVDRASVGSGVPAGEDRAERDNGRE